MGIGEGEHVVHAGCCIGYYTAIIVHRVGETGRVIAIELDADLGARTRVNLRRLCRVEVVTGNAPLRPRPCGCNFRKPGRDSSL
jgi:protein-L-isoaspartate(D-aspartate) O-methyltransferase